MPPATKKDCTIILFDANTKFKEIALKTLLKICCKKFFTGSKDLIKVIVTNTKETNNRMADRYGGYENINECMEEPMLYNPKFILNLIEGSEPAEANWLEALTVAVKSLHDDFSETGGVVSLQLLFITDLSVQLCNYKQNTIQELIDDLFNFEIFLYIIGPNIDVPFTIKNADDIRLWMSEDNLKVNEDGKNLKIAKEIITNTPRSVICNATVGVNLFSAFKNWGGTQPWQVPLSIGTKIQLPAQTMRVLKKGLDCKIVSNQRDFSKTVWINAEDEAMEIQSEDVINGILRHGKFVEVSDNKMFKCDNPRSFSILCFTNSLNVSEYLMRGEGSYYVLPNGTSEANEAMYILIDCLSHQDKCIIARRVYNNNFAPKFVILMPKPDHNPRCFVLAELPYADDVRFNYIEKNVKCAPKIDVEEGVYNFLDAVDVDSGKSIKKIPLSITMMQDSNCARIINKTADKYLDKHLGLEEVDLNYLNKCIPEEIADKFKAAWPERQIQKAKKKEEVGENDDGQSDNDFDW